MPPRLLIINCASPYFFYIPMGSFGLCDYLGQRGLAARIFNPALYRTGEAHLQLLAALTDFQPTHVGFVLHWQETAHGLLPALAAVKAWKPTVVTLCGGFTASYFAEDLLETVAELDYVVVGDPEEPVAQLLEGIPPAAIANLVWREESGTVHRNENRWLISPPLLDRLSFAGLHFLIDADRYLEKINTKLGFPIFLGRGCVFDCDYCGGSRHAFRLHSGRHKPVTRSVAPILADLHLLKGQTSLLYICYENDPVFVLTLFRAIAEDLELQGYFTLHYGAWHLLDHQFVKWYRAAFNCSATPPIFEFSPEVYGDAQRAVIKGGLTYTLEQLRQNISEIDHAFNGRVRIEVFFSRYHPSLTQEMLLLEIREIFLLKHQLFLQEAAPVHLCFDHLSTDVASRYWEEHIEHPCHFSTLLQLKQKVDEGRLYPFPVDNLCLFIPAHLSPGFCLGIEAMTLVLEQLERQCHELFHVLFVGLGVRWLQELEQLLVPHLEGESVPPFFATPPLDALLERLGQRWSGDVEFSAALPFLGDLVRFSRKKIDLASRPVAQYGLSAYTGCFVINPHCVAVHEHDYLDLRSFIKRLQQGKGGPFPYQRTVYFFMNNGIVALPHAYYRATFSYFERPQTVAAYQASIGGVTWLNMDRHNRLLHQLIEEGLLVPTDNPMADTSCQGTASYANK